jgi:aromatic-L-amino-acid/L-tryptophan decarboxylase
MNTDEFRRTGHELIEWIAAYRDRMEDLPVMSPVSPGDIARQLPSDPPQLGAVNTT